MSLIQIQMRLRGARQVAAQTKAVSASMKGMAASAASATAASAAGFRKMLPSMAAVKSAGLGMKSVGRSMTTGFTLPVVAAGAVAGKMSIDFANSVNEIETQAGATAKEVDKMRKSIMAYAMSGKSSEGPNELAKGMYRIASAGLRGKAAMDAMVASEQLATVGRSDMETTATAVAAAVSSGIKGTKDYTKTIGQLNAIVGAGNMRMENLTSALGTGILPSMKAAGVSIAETGAAIGTLTTQGMPANAAATRLRMAISMLQAPTDEAGEALNKMGLGTLELSKMMLRGNFVGMIQKLKEKMGGLSEAQRNVALSEIFGGGKSSAGIVALLGSTDMLEQKFKQINNKAGTFKKTLDSVNETPQVRLQAAWARIQAIFIKIGDGLLPIMVPILEKVGDIIVTIGKAFQSLPGPVQKGLIVLVGLVAIAGPLLSMFGSIVLGIYAVNIALGFLAANPIVLIIAAIVALGVGLYVAYKKVGWFRDGVDAVFGFLKTAVVTVVNFVKDHWQLIVSAILGPVTLIGYAVIKNWDKIKSGTVAAWNFVKKIISRVVSGVIGFIKSHWRLIISILGGPMGLAVALITKHWGKIKAGASAAVGFVKSAFGSVVSFFGSIPGRLAAVGSGMFDFIKNAFKSAINFVIGGWNSLSFRIPEIDPPGPGPKFGGMTISVPQIPKLAKGGVFAGAGWSVVGDKGPELMHGGAGARVVPLSKRSRSTPGLDALGGGHSRDSGPIHAHLYLDGREIAVAIAEVGENERALR